MNVPNVDKLRHVDDILAVKKCRGVRLTLDARGLDGRTLDRPVTLRGVIEGECGHEGWVGLCGVKSCNGIQWARVHTACSSVHSPTIKTTWEPLEMALFLMESGWSLRPTGYSLPVLSSFVSAARQVRYEESVSRAGSLVGGGPSSYSSSKGPEMSHMLEGVGRERTRRQAPTDASRRVK